MKKLLIILAILFPLTSLAESKHCKIDIELREIATALKIYHIDFGKVPTEEEGLDKLKASTKFKLEYIDPFGVPYAYKVRYSESNTVVLLSSTHTPEGKSYCKAYLEVVLVNNA